MSQAPNASANTKDFEFAALNNAANYRKALLSEFAEFLKGDVVEVGAGIGQITEPLSRMSAVKRVVAVEPDREFCAQHRLQFPRHELIQGTAKDLPRNLDWDAVLSVNVLEHIEQHEGELKLYSSMLRRREGHLCLFVPARPEIYSPIDKDFGHFRRYRRIDLRHLLHQAGFVISRLSYFNFVGYFAWWLNFCLLKKRHFEPGKVLFFDRAIFPFVHALERRIHRPPFGQSLLAIAQSRGTSFEKTQKS
jgi:SAM-dependent methyltransferase